MLCIYLILQYFDPAKIYPALDVLPWDKIVLGLTVLSWPMDPHRRWVRDSANIWMTLFLLVIIVSSALATYPAISWSHWFDFLDWYVIYFLIINMVTTGERYFIFIAIFSWPISSSLLWCAHMGDARDSVLPAGALRVRWGTSTIHRTFPRKCSCSCPSHSSWRCSSSRLPAALTYWFVMLRCDNWSNVCPWRQQPGITGRFGLPDGVDSHSA